MKKITFKSLLLAVLCFAPIFASAGTLSFDFKKIEGFDVWGSSYLERSVEYDDANVTFADASRQVRTIVNMPIVKNGPVTVEIKNGITASAVKLYCRQWNSNKQAVKLVVGGTEYTSTLDKATGVVLLDAKNLPAKTKVLEFTFTKPGDQIGIDSLVIETVPPAVERPAFSPAPGTYLNPVEVTLSCSTKDAKIFYTTDSAFVADEGPVALTKNTVIRAYAVKGSDTSVVASAEYIIPQHVADLAEYVAASAVDDVQEFVIDGEVQVTYLFDDTKKNYQKLVYMQDASAAVCAANDSLYDTLLSDELGVRLTGLKADKDFASWAIDKKTPGELVPDLVSVSEVTDTILNRFVKIDAAVLKSAFNTNALGKNNAEISDGAVTLKVRNHFREIDESVAEVGDSVVFTGIVSKYNGSMQVKLISYSKLHAPIVVDAPVFSQKGGEMMDTVTLTLTAADGAEIYYTLNGGKETLYEAPIIISETTEVSAYAKVGEAMSDVVSEYYVFPVFVDDLAAWVDAASADNNAVIAIRGEVVVTYVSPYGNIFMQDSTSQINAFDKYSPLKVGDHLTGLVAKGGKHNNALQMNIVRLPEIVAGNAVADVMSVAEVSAAIDDRYVRLENVYMSEPFVKDGRGAYDAKVKDGESVLAVRHHWTNDQAIVIDTTVTAGAKVNVEGIVDVYKDEVQLRIVKFEKLTDGVDALDDAELSSCVYSNNGTLFVEAEAGDMINVYAVDGRNIYSAVAESSVSAINLDADIVIVRVSDEVHKVIMK